MTTTEYWALNSIFDCVVWFIIGAIWWPHRHTLRAKNGRFISMKKKSPGYRDPHFDYGYADAHMGKLPASASKHPRIEKRYNEGYVSGNYDRSRFIGHAEAYRRHLENLKEHEQDHWG
jgi:hypothetical protein